MNLSVLLVPIAIFALFASSIKAQAPCKPPEIIDNKNVGNMFTEEQEVYLGDVVAETLQRNFLVLPDEASSGYLQRIGDRLLTHLPPTRIKFRFFVVDSPEVNAFNIAGGRVYITRKLIGFVRNEDELAGIIGHELGHGIVRHSSADISKLFREILGVTKIGDRQDVYEKFNQFLDRQRTKRIKQKSGHEGGQQLEADRMGLLAMMAAGYDPQAYASAWERVTDIKSKNRNVLDDILGTDRSDERRLREILKAIGTIPPECRESNPDVSPGAFAKWQAQVLSAESFPHEEKFRGLLRKGTLTPPLRGSITHFQFSPDGKYIVAQDTSGINILSRDPFSFLFRLEIGNAKPAHFSSDSKTLIFQTTSLRVEAWDIESRQAVMTREVYVKDGCRQTQLSPDGKTLACYTTMGDLQLVDVATNDKILLKPNFHIPSFFEFLMRGLFQGGEVPGETNTLEMEFSPDSRYILASRVSRYSTVPITASSFASVPGRSIREPSLLAYDLKTRTELKLPESLKNIVSMPFSFYSNDRIIGQHKSDPEKSGIFLFPGGERVEQFLIRANSYEKPFKGDYIFVRPTKNHPVAAYSVSTKKMFLSNNPPALGGWGDIFVAESVSGAIDLMRLEGAEIESLGSVSLPSGGLGSVKAIALSEELNKLALSERTRGGAWDLTTGRMKMYSRSFTGAYMDQNGVVHVNFPPADESPQSIGQLVPDTGKVNKLEPVKNSGSTQIGKFLLRIKTKGDEKLEKETKEHGDAAAGEKPRALRLNFYDLDFVGTTLEVSDVVTQAPLWSRHFENETPEYVVNPVAETITLCWEVTTRSAREAIKNDANLARRLKAMGEKAGDYLVQVLDANTGDELGSALIETGEGSFRIRNAVASGDWLAIIDSENRVQFFSLKTGELQSRVFGEKVVVSTSRSIAVVENIPGILSVVDITNGRRIEELRFPSRISHASFDKAGGKLFVLTADQRYYIFDATVFGTAG